jgi:hypothetical protein
MVATVEGKGVLPSLATAKGVPPSDAEASVIEGASEDAFEQPRVAPAADANVSASPPTVPRSEQIPHEDRIRDV